MLQAPPIATANTMSPGEAPKHSPAKQEFAGFVAGHFVNISAQPIGSGAHKTAHSATYTGPDTPALRSGAQVALLYFKDNVVPALQEYTVMTQIRAPHLAKFYGTVVGRGPRLCLVSDFAAFGAIPAFFEYAEDNDIVVSISHKLVMARQAGDGLASLHEHNLVHADVAARNVLVYSFDEDSHHQTHVKLSDYGLVRERSKYTGTSGAKDEEGQGLPLAAKWASWESLTKDRFYSASDVWSFAVLIWEMLTGGHAPYQDVGDTISAMIQHLSAGHRLARPRECPDSLWDVLTRCWCEKRTQRPDLRSVLTQLSQTLEKVAGEAMSATATAQLTALQSVQQAWTKDGFGWRSCDIALGPALDAELHYVPRGPAVVYADPQDHAVVPGSVAEKLADAIEKLATVQGGRRGGDFRANVDTIAVCKNQSLIDHFNGRLVRLHEQRHLTSGTGLFNRRWHDAALTSAQLVAMKATHARLERLFVDTDMASGSGSGVNVALMWHGVPSDAAADAILRMGLSSRVSNEDEGFFGKGVYLTPEAEYAAFYANGQKTPTRGATYTLLLCAVCLANPYPLTRAVDYEASTSPPISRFHYNYGAVGTAKAS
jgi:serine/threonine protein kinase